MYFLQQKGVRCNVCRQLYRGFLTLDPTAPFCSIECQEKKEREIRANIKLAQQNRERGLFNELKKLRE